jgi:hypothetical protein
MLKAILRSSQHDLSSPPFLSEASRQSDDELKTAETEPHSLMDGLGLHEAGAKEGISCHPNRLSFSVQCIYELLFS